MDVVKTGGFVIAVVGLLTGTVRPWWKGRRADPHLTLRRVSRTWAGGKVYPEWYLVLVNDGTAPMTQVDVQVLGRQGAPIKSQNGSITMDFPPMPLSVVHPRQDVWLKVELNGIEEDLGHGLVGWWDGRRRYQTREFVLTERPDH